MRSKYLKTKNTRTTPITPITLEPLDDSNNVEQLAFLMFKDSSTKMYKRFVIYIVHLTIRSNPSITLSSLIFILERKMLLSSSDIISAVSVLQNSEVFNAVSSWSNTKTTHLRVKDSVVYDTWVKSTIQGMPHIVKLSSPVLHKNKQQPSNG